MKISKREELLLLADILDKPVDELYLNIENLVLTNAQLEQFKVYYQRFLNNEPVSKIINKRAFWNDVFYVNEDVLDPRPETELIIETVMKCINSDSKINILDLGTGSGCIILSLLREFKNAFGVGVDISSKAIEIAKRNQRNLHINTAEFYCSNWKDFSTKAKFDVIVSNPPYIKSSEISLLDDNVKNFDPILALDGGNSGLKCYEDIVALLPDLLKYNGLFVCEIGYNQLEDVTNILKNSGFKRIVGHNDLAGIPRVVNCYFS